MTDHFPPGPDEEAYIDLVCELYSGFTLFDVGASVGRYTDTVRLRSGDHVLSHMFEPRSSAVEVLRLKYAGDPKKTVINDFGLGAVACDKYLVLEENLEHSHISNKMQDDRHNETVSIMPLDDYLITVKQELGVIFLKIDTESYEIEVLKGAQGSLNRVGAVQFEYGGGWETLQGTKLTQARDLLEDFTIYEWVDGQIQMLQDWTDHYTYRNYLALPG
jgi:FkbM family methyltransferase